MKKLLLFSLFTLLASAMGWAATETWVKVTSTPDSWGGDYLIVYEEGKIAFDGSLTKLDAANNTTPVTISSDGTIRTITTTDCNFYFTIANISGNNYSIKSNSGYYIGFTGEKNGLNADKKVTYNNTLAVSNGVATIVSKSTLKYNSAKDQKRFRYYLSGQQPIALYKKATKVAPLEYSPAFGDIAKGTEVTISCATEGAVLNGTIETATGTATLKGETLPYTFTASEIGKIEVGVWATKEGLEESEPLSGTYNVCQPKVAPLEINPGFGTIEVGTEITISCATEGAVLNGLIGDTKVTNATLPYTFTADKEGEISVLLTASKKEYDESEQLYGDFIVKDAVPVAYRDVIVYTDEKIFTPTTSYKTFKFSKGGAAYIVTSAITTGIQLNAKNAQDKGFPGLVMTVSKTSPSKIIITWNGKTVSGRTLQIYGKNVPYSATSELYDSNKGNLIETVKYDASLTTTVELDGAYTYIGIVPSGSNAMYIDSFEFIWNEGAAGGADVTYTKASEAKAGNFAVLATATADGKAIGRNADLNPVNVTVSGDAIGLDKSQAEVDEFEIVEKDAVNKKFQLCGGLSKSRRFLTYDAAGGVTTTAATVTKVDGKDVVSTTDDNADVTFVSKAAGLLVKFKDGQYLMFNGTKFIKADYGEAGEAVVQADGKTLTPVIVFMSSSNVSTGVETVEFDENAEAQYFNLNGVQVKAENLTPGLYIVRQGNKVSKQVIR